FYLVTVFYPVTTTLGLMKRTIVDLQKLPQKRQRVGSIVNALFAPKVYIEPLEKARRENEPDFAPLCIYLAELEGEAWRGILGESIRPLNPESKDDHSYIAVRYAVEAQKIDPEGPEGYL